MLFLGSVPIMRDHTRTSVPMPRRTKRMPDTGVMYLAGMNVWSLPATRIPISVAKLRAARLPRNTARKL